MDDSERDHLLGEIFDAATAYRVVLSELIVELVEGGALSRTGAANVVVRSEALMRHLPDHSVARQAHALLAADVQSRLALQPDVFVRRKQDPKDQRRDYPKPLPGDEDEP